MTLLFCNLEELGHNRFAPLARLTCSQKRTLDRMGALKVHKIPKRQASQPNISRSAKKNRKNRISRKARHGSNKEIPVVQVHTVSARSRSPSPTAEHGERRSSTPPQEPMAASSRVLTRSMVKALPHPPSFEALPLLKKRTVTVQAGSSSTPTHPPQEPVASAYMAGGSSGPTMEDLMAKLMEMQANMNRMQVDLDQVKASASQEPRLPVGEDDHIPQPPEPIHVAPMAQPYAAGPSRPFMMHPAQPRSQEESFYQDSIPPTPHVGIQRDELEGASVG